MMNIFLTAALAILSLVSFSQSDCSVISDGTYGNTQTSPFSPLYGLYDYGRSATIYYAADIGGAKNIAHIAWYVDEFQSGYSQSGPYTFSNVKIYFAYTTLSGWSNINNVSGVDMLSGVNAAQGITSWTKVFDGSVTFNSSNSWKYIPLDTPFSYNGTSNLVVQVENWDGSYSSGYPVFHYTSTSASSLRTTKYHNADGSMPSTGTDATRSYSRPDIQFCDATTLPIELMYFRGKSESASNLLWWSTASENGNDYFTIEKSTDGEYWNLVGQIKGAGNSAHTLSYSYRDRDISPEICYYRLKQTDFDGRFEYSDIISVDNRDFREKTIERTTNILGQDIDLRYYRGVVLIYYSDGSSEKLMK